MEGLQLEGSQRLSYRDDLPLPVVEDGYCLLKVRKAGICGTDLGLLAGLYDFQGIPGHEFVGIVEQGPGRLKGRRVVGDINIACQTCANCLAGSRKHCLARKVLGIRRHHGAFASYLTLPEENLVTVPESLPDEEAVFAEPLAAVLDIIAKVPVVASDRVLLIGDGRMGQLAARVLGRFSDHLYLMGKHAHKLALLPQGVVTTTDEAAWNQPTFDLVVECTGHPSGLQAALRRVKARGKIVLKSTYADRLSIDASRLVVDEITLIGSRCGDMGQALKLMEEAPLGLGELIHAHYSLAQYAQAFADARRWVKVVFDV